MNQYKPFLGERFEDALQYAHEIHRADTRKSTAIPYMSHLLSACALVMEDGGDEDECIAALLHDSLEDHPEIVNKAGLAQRFGNRVADLVELCTDTPPEYAGGTKPPWRERKELYIARLRREGYPLCRVSLADKLHNLRSIAKDHRRVGDEVWSRFHAGKEDQLWYYRSLTQAFRDGGAPAHLVNELDGLLAEVEK